MPIDFQAENKERGVRMSKKISRRDLLKTTLAGAGLMVSSNLIASKWMKPVMAAGNLPIHAKASGAVTATPAPTASPTPTYNPYMVWYSGFPLQSVSSGRADLKFSVQLWDSDLQNFVLPDYDVDLIVEGSDSRTYTLHDATTQTTDSDGVAYWTSPGVYVTWTPADTTYSFVIYATCTGGTPLASFFDSP